MKDLKKILVAEDDPSSQMIIKLTLESSYSVTLSSNAQEAISQSENQKFDAIILDIVLPDNDGYFICQNIRSNGPNKETPILFLSSKDGTGDKVFAFQMGGDDYLKKPFHSQELLARLEARLKRPHLKSNQDITTIKFESILVQLTSNKVYLDKVDLKLTRKEYLLLVYFLNHQDRVFSREQILNSIWGESLNVNDRTVDTHISRLRKKLSLSEKVLESVHGLGYRWNSTNPQGDSNS